MLGSQHQTQPDKSCVIIECMKMYDFIQRSNHGRHVHSDNNSTSLGSIQPHCIQREDYSFITVFLHNLNVYLRVHIKTYFQNGTSTIIHQTLMLMSTLTLLFCAFQLRSRGIYVSFHHSFSSGFAGLTYHFIILVLVKFSPSSSSQSSSR